jgi:hypothetical protein
MRHTREMGRGGFSIERCMMTCTKTVWNGHETVDMELGRCFVLYMAWIARLWASELTMCCVYHDYDILERSTL